MRGFPTRRTPWSILGFNAGLKSRTMAMTDTRFFFCFHKRMEIGNDILENCKYYHFSLFYLYDVIFSTGIRKKIIIVRTILMSTRWPDSYESAYRFLRAWPVNSLLHVESHNTFTFILTSKCSCVRVHCCDTMLCVCVCVGVRCGMCVCVRWLL